MGVPLTAGLTLKKHWYRFPQTLLGHGLNPTLWHKPICCSLRWVPWSLFRRSTSCWWIARNAATALASPSRWTRSPWTTLQSWSPLRASRKAPSSRSLKVCSLSVGGMFCHRGGCLAIYIDEFWSCLWFLSLSLVSVLALPHFHTQYTQKWCSGQSLSVSKNPIMDSRTTVVEIIQRMISVCRWAGFVTSVCWCVGFVPKQRCVCEWGIAMCCKVNVCYC